MTEAGILERIEGAAAEVRLLGATAPKIALSVTSLDDLGEHFRQKAELQLAAPGASGGLEGAGLRLGTIGGVEVLALVQDQLRAPSLREATLPIRLARRLGAEVLLISGRGWSLNPLWARARLMLVVDHINLLGGNPLVGPNPEELGARFPDMSEVYDSRLRHLAEESALSRGIHFVRGVYIARAAETSKESEANLLRRLGGDAVGEGIVPDAIVAVHGGMKVLGMIRLEASPGGRESSSTPTTLAIAEVVAGVVSRI